MVKSSPALSAAVAIAFWMVTPASALPVHIECDQAPAINSIPDINPDRISVTVSIRGADASELIAKVVETSNPRNKRPTTRIKSFKVKMQRGSFGASVQTIVGTDFRLPLPFLSYKLEVRLTSSFLKRNPSSVWCKSLP